MTWIIEVKETGATYADGDTRVALSSGGGRALEQKEDLQRLQREHPEVVAGFLVRRKGQIHDDRPRWTWHSVHDLGTDTVIRAGPDAMSLKEVFG